MRSKIFFILLSFAFVIPSLAAEDRLVNLSTRPGVSLSVYYMKQEGSKATVALLPGGSGSIGMKNGVPASNNFLVRSRDFFAANGLNVALVDKPSDKDDLDYADRVSPEHIEDLRQVAVFLKKDAGLPLWLVGTSRGTVSATAAAIVFGNEELAGIVLTSSVTSNKKAGAVPYQKIDLIRIPVLVLHHEYDGCKICVPRDVPLIMRGLRNAPVKKEIFVKGGANPRGDPCQASHWHGFIGMEREAVDIISNWIKKPTP